MTPILCLIVYLVGCKNFVRKVGCQDLPITLNVNGVHKKPFVQHISYAIVIWLKHVQNIFKRMILISFYIPVETKLGGDQGFLDGLNLGVILTLKLMPLFKDLEAIGKKLQLLFPSLINYKSVKN